MNWLFVFIGGGIGSLVRFFISVKLPYIKLYNYNATLKIDDTTWGHSNPGVWCHSLHDLMDRKVYTDWKDYVGDDNV